MRPPVTWLVYVRSLCLTPGNLVKMIALCRLDACASLSFELSRCFSKKLLCRHPIVEVPGELLWGDPDLVALAAFEHLACARAIRSDPQRGRVRHRILDETNSDGFAGVADLHQGADQLIPFNVLPPNWRRNHHVFFPW